MDIIEVYVVSVAVISALTMGVLWILSLFPTKNKQAKKHESMAWKIVLPVLFGVVILGLAAASVLTALDTNASNVDTGGYWFLSVVALIISGGFFAMAIMVWYHNRRTTNKIS